MLRLALRSAAIKLMRGVRQTGSTPAKTGSYRKPLLADHEARVREWRRIGSLGRCGRRGSIKRLSPGRSSLKAWPEKSGGGIEPSPHDLKFD
jgi:hypothetical protein